MIIDVFRRLVMLMMRTNFLNKLWYAPMWITCGCKGSLLSFTCNKHSAYYTHRVKSFGNLENIILNLPLKHQVTLLVIPYSKGVRFRNADVNTFLFRSVTKRTDVYDLLALHARIGTITEKDYIRASFELEELN